MPQFGEYQKDLERKIPVIALERISDQENAKVTDISPWPKGIGAITLFVEDLAAAKQFYRETFGLPVEFEGDTSAVFKFGNTLINLLAITSADELIAPAQAATREAGSRVVFTIRVEDVDALCAELTGRGLVLLNGPMDRPWGIRTASFSDPGGHIWEIAQ
jgi:catechol 2,3-dioxygenase-like lactoylglutathione lyase family enzyme